MALVIERVGGVAEFADIVAEILIKPHVAPVAKQRIIDNMIRLMQHVEMKSAPEGDLSQHSTEDIQRMLQEQLSVMNAKETPGTTR